MYCSRFIFVIKWNVNCINNVCTPRNCINQLTCEPTQLNYGIFLHHYHHHQPAAYNPRFIRIRPLVMFLMYMSFPILNSLCDMPCMHLQLIFYLNLTSCASFSMHIFHHTYTNLDFRKNIKLHNKFICQCFSSNYFTFSGEYASIVWA